VNEEALAHWRAVARKKKSIINRFVLGVNLGT
jgi:hypothetical protein